MSAVNMLDPTYHTFAPTLRLHALELDKDMVFTGSRIPIDRNYTRFRRHLFL